jgi:antibiotic biosynthesis monooxygenase (ABM) superfamily enzyme
LVDHLVLFRVREDAAPEEVEELLGGLRALRSAVPNVVDISVGENFSERGGSFTHGLFVRFATPDDLHAYMGHPEHLKVVERLDALTEGDRIVVDYDFDPAA